MNYSDDRRVHDFFRELGLTLRQIMEQTLDTLPDDLPQKVDLSNSQQEPVLKIKEERGE